MRVPDHPYSSRQKNAAWRLILIFQVKDQIFQSLGHMFLDRFFRDLHRVRHVAVAEAIDFVGDKDTATLRRQLCDKRHGPLKPAPGIEGGLHVGFILHDRILHAVCMGVGPVLVAGVLVLRLSFSVERQIVGGAVQKGTKIVDGILQVCPLEFQIDVLKDVFGEGLVTESGNQKALQFWPFGKIRVQDLFLYPTVHNSQAPTQYS